MAAKKKKSKAKKAAPRMSAWELELHAQAAKREAETQDHAKCIVALSKSIKSLATIQMQQLQEQTEGSLREASLDRIREVVVTCRKVGDFYGVTEEKTRPTTDV